LHVATGEVIALDHAFQFAVVAQFQVQEAVKESPHHFCLRPVAFCYVVGNNPVETVAERGEGRQFRQFLDMASNQFVVGRL